ncbi:MAG: hypothetical protein AB1846_03700 [Chloroflexota bacterium]
MDPIKILKRAWHILWNYRALWVFGLILALTAGTPPSNPGSNSSYQTNQQEWQNRTIPEDMRQSFEQAWQEIQGIWEHGLPSAGISAQEITAFVWILAILLALGLVLSIGMAFARYVSETAVIKMVDGYEETGQKLSLREGFRIGWSRTSWRLFLINLIVSLPAILLVLALIATGVLVFLSVTRGGDGFAIASVVGGIGLAFLLIFVVVILSIALSLLRHFFWRACALEDLGVGDSFRRGWAMVKENWKNVGLMWLVMIGLGIAWALVSAIGFILTLPLLIVTGVAGAAVAALPVLIAYGLSSLALGGWLPWVVAGLVGLPFFLIVAFSPWLVIGGWAQVFTSSVWTLTYRELKSLPEQPVEVVPAEA